MRNRAYQFLNLPPKFSAAAGLFAQGGPPYMPGLAAKTMPTTTCQFTARSCLRKLLILSAMWLSKATVEGSSRFLRNLGACHYRPFVHARTVLLLLCHPVPDAGFVDSQHLLRPAISYGLPIGAQNAGVLRHTDVRGSVVRRSTLWPCGQRGRGVFPLVVAILFVRWLGWGGRLGRLGPLLRSAQASPCVLALLLVNSPLVDATQAGRKARDCRVV